MRSRQVRRSSRRILILEGTDDQTEIWLLRMNLAGFTSSASVGMQTHAPACQLKNISATETSKERSDICATRSRLVIGVHALVDSKQDLTLRWLTRDRFGFAAAAGRENQIGIRVVASSWAAGIPMRFGRPERSSMQTRRPLAQLDFPGVPVEEFLAKLLVLRAGRGRVQNSKDARAPARFKHSMSRPAKVQWNICCTRGEDAQESRVTAKRARGRKADHASRSPNAQIAGLRMKWFPPLDEALRTTSLCRPRKWQRRAALLDALSNTRSKII